MNQVTFYRLKDGVVETRRVKVIQPSYAVIIGAAKGQKKCNTPRGRTVAEAEDFMIRAGWTRKKPKVPAAMRKAA